MMHFITHTYTNIKLYYIFEYQLYKYQTCVLVTDHIAKQMQYGTEPVILKIRSIDEVLLLWNQV